ncbi:hypothetical protein BAS10_04475 [Elizabethkingia meningoseptica]|uniref:DUF6706 family protein n=1 Tax=Elizabethkingia meningoseptica TaxID=238 RepID=UPI000999D44D|nr:DUF6706 family protein [Elizabethkingia meningoseptica]OPB98929.1 hypothetical protein BAS10_04475 [Elizabethkingia meningoseptica]
MPITNQNYFKSKLSLLGITMSDQDLEIFFLSKEVIPTDSLTDPKQMDVLFTEIVLGLLVRPDISEDDYSIKYNKDSLEAWYSFECTRLGIENLLKKGESEVKDMSFLS